MAAKAHPLAPQDRLPIKYTISKAFLQPISTRIRQNFFRKTKKDIRLCRTPKMVNPRLAGGYRVPRPRTFRKLQTSPIRVNPDSRMYSVDSRLSRTPYTAGVIYYYSRPARKMQGSRTLFRRKNQERKNQERKIRKEKSERENQKGKIRKEKAGPKACPVRRYSVIQWEWSGTRSVWAPPWERRASGSRFRISPSRSLRRSRCRRSSCG